MNLTIARALLWEYYRLARRPLGLLVLSSWSLAALYSTALEELGARQDALVFTSLFVTLCIVYLPTLLTCRSDGMTLGFERRLYRLPVSTASLVLARWAPALLAATIGYCATVVFMSWTFDARWPLTGPLLVLLSFVSTGLALVWTLGSRPLLLAPIGLPLFGVLFLWLRRFLHVAPERGLAVWNDFGPSETFGLLGVLASSTFLATVGVQRDRSMQSPRASWNPLRSRARTSRPPQLRSGRDAQMFMEWREKGRWLPLVSTASLAAAVLAGGFPTYETGPVLRHALIAFALCLVALPPVAGFLHGWFDLKKSLATLDRLRATRPLSDRQLADVLLLAAVRAVLAGWLAAFLALVGVFLLTGLFGDRDKTLLVIEGFERAAAHVHTVDLALFFAVLLSWAVAGSGSMLALVASGKGWMIMAFAVGPYVWVLLGLAAERLLGLSLVLDVLPWGAGGLLTLLPLSTAGCLVACWRLGHYEGREVIRALMPYLALNLLLLWRSPFLQQALAPNEPWIARSAALLVPAALSALVLPRFLAPLTLGANRHR